MKQNAQAQYHIRATVYKSLINLGSFQDTSFDSSHTEVVRHSSPVVNIQINEVQVSTKDSERQAVDRSHVKSNVLNPFLVVPQKTISMTKKIGQFVTTDSSHIVKLDDDCILVPFGIDSIDLRKKGIIPAKTLRDIDSACLEVNIGYELHNYPNNSRQLFSTSTKVDLKGILTEWLNEEKENLAKHQTSEDMSVPWKAHREFIVPVLKSDIKKDFPELAKTIGKEFSLLDLSTVQNQVGKVFLRVDLVNDNHFKVVENDGQNETHPVQAQPDLIDVMEGSFGPVVLSNFVTMYSSESNSGKKCTVHSLNRAIHELWRICPPVAFEKLLDLKLSQSNSNPITSTLESFKFLRKRIQKADHQSRLKWVEIHDNVEGRITSYLDRIPDLPSSSIMIEQKQKLLEAVPKAALQAESKSTTGHPVLTDHIIHRWTKPKPIELFKHIPFLYTSKMLSQLNSPKYLYYFHVAAYIFFVITLTMPFIVNRDESYYFATYLESGILQGFRDISDEDSFWAWSTDVFSKKMFEPPERLSYMIPIEKVLLRQFRSPSKECKYDQNNNNNPVYTAPTNMTCVGDLNFWNPVLQTGGEWVGTTWSDTIGSSIRSANTAWFPKGGYHTYLNLNQTEFTSSLEYLRDNGWIDIQTKAIVFDFAVYNMNEDVFCVMRLVIEFLTSGGVIPSVMPYFINQIELESTLLPVEQSESLDYFGIAIFFLAIGFLLLEVREVLEDGLANYFLDFWNYTDILFFLGSLITYLMKLGLPGRLNPFDVTTDYLYNTWDFVFGRRVAYGFFTLWAYIRLLQYLRFYRTTGPLIIAMKEMISDVINFLFLFVVVMMGWSIIMSQLVSSLVYEYKNVGSSVFTLLKAGIGGGDFIDVNSGGASLNQDIANVFFALYLLLSIILLINLLIAMMGSTYDRIQEEALGEWGFEFTQAVLFYEKPVWIPPLNIIADAVSLVSWMLNRLTCGLLPSNILPMDGEFPLVSMSFGLKSNEKKEEVPSYQFSDDLIMRILSPTESVDEWGENLEEKTEPNFDGDYNGKQRDRSMTSSAAPRPPSGSSAARRISKFSNPRSSMLMMRSSKRVSYYPSSTTKYSSESEDFSEDSRDY
eukprot:TRINITY_DN6052_c0_g1_i1.p1 TRINITY_DN6052_c0_g1~~TRINITY_DN6052_c0_g1_i1.p1  ORF type:complete len:1100 (+),score=275.09 TRINITY_DN6052_c0_g1_i1:3-3302(+)